MYGGFGQKKQMTNRGFLMRDERGQWDEKEKRKNVPCSSVHAKNPNFVDRPKYSNKYGEMTRAESYRVNTDHFLTAE